VPVAIEIRGTGEILSEVAVGFMCRVADRSDPSRLFTRPDPAIALRGTEDDVDLPNG
jgi:hypothetical protein